MIIGGEAIVGDLWQAIGSTDHSNTVFNFEKYNSWFLQNIVCYLNLYFFLSLFTVQFMIIGGEAIVGDLSDKQ